MLPHARSEGLVIRELPEETLVYDLKRHRAHCLNPTAARVWSYCDGQTRYTQPAGSPHLRIGVGDDRLLTPGEQVTVTLQFRRRGPAPLTFQPRVLAGEGRP
jgi:hypothetical protein